MLDLSLPDAQLPLALLEEQHKLQAFANLSVLDSTDEKDGYLQACNDFVLGSTIDSVEGCYFIQKNDSYYYSALHNATCASWLLAAGRALFSGELTQFGKLMIESLAKNLWDGNKNAFKEGIVFQAEQVPFSLPVPSLLDSLTKNEFSLLEGYLGKSIAKNEFYVDAIFRCRLENAAEKAGLYLKQAQIVDGALRQKLMSLSKNGYRDSEPVELNEREQAIVFSCLTHARLWHGREIEFECYGKLKARLQNAIERLDEANTLVQIVYSLFESLQLEYSKEQMSELLNLVNLRVNQIDLAQLETISKIQLSRLYYALVQIDPTVRRPSELIQLASQNDISRLDVIKCSSQVILSQNNRKTFFEKYKINQVLIQQS